ncbi:glycosyltransferase [Nostoc sp. CCY0012]|uniref:glycosyltransferase n=1 Tax=Nostoc sp. CCY0012 TaxID=1056123 RepID=UPI0039C6DED6
MRILHVIPSVSMVRGGTSQAVLDMVQALQAKNVDAEIATTNDNGDGLLDVPLQKCVEYEKVPTWFFPRFSPTAKAVREYAFSWQLTQWLWQNMCQYDLVHIHALFSYPSTIAMAIARLQNLPYIVSPHGLLCEWSLQQSTRKKQMYLRLIEKANINHCQAVHFTSEQEQQEVSQLGLSALNFVLPLGLSFPKQIGDARYKLRQSLNIPAEEPIILFLSRLHPKKGLDFLIPSLSQLADRRFTFILAGSGSPDYESKIKSLLMSYGLSNRTHFAGFVEGENKNLLLQGSDLFVLTSYSENFGVAVLEALAAGLPVLITPGVALASMLEQHQLAYVVQQDVSEITNAILDFLNSPKLAQQMGERAHKFVLEKYTWENIAGKMIRVYTSNV